MNNWNFYPQKMWHVFTVDTKDGTFNDLGVFTHEQYVRKFVKPPPWLERIRELVNQLTASSGSAQADPKVRANRVSEEP